MCLPIRSPSSLEPHGVAQRLVEAPHPLYIVFPTTIPLRVRVRVYLAGEGESYLVNEDEGYLRRCEFPTRRRPAAAHSVHRRRRERPPDPSRARVGLPTREGAAASVQAPRGVSRLTQASSRLPVVAGQHRLAGCVGGQTRLPPSRCLRPVRPGARSRGVLAKGRHCLEEGTGQATVVKAEVEEEEEEEEETERTEGTEHWKVYSSGGRKVAAVAAAQVPWKPSLATTLLTAASVACSFTQSRSKMIHKGGGGGVKVAVVVVVVAVACYGNRDMEVDCEVIPPPLLPLPPQVQRRRAGLQRLREEFRLENLYLEHKVPHLFVSSQWQQHNRMSCLYLGYRLFWALYFSMWAVWAWVGSMGYDAPASLKVYFPTYLTNWSIWTLAVDTSLQAVNVILHLKKIADDGDVVYPSMTRLMKVSWVLSNIMGPVHLFVALGYWIVVFPNRSDESLNEIGINTHIMPALYILLDLAVSATPRRLVHVYQPIIFVFTYVFFNLIYYLCGGLDYLGRPALYPFMDWTQPGSTIGIMFVTIFGVIPFLHAVICLLYASRINMWRRLKISRYAREEDEMDQVDGAQEQKV
ncbi:hypothetical protein O3P69_002418 [Scylla paramamosain]|uniref:Protein rolling stone n=1 Tax=Scylla paramamosain TaxID=85552 RepID=A0AAW0V6K1_SCYPA